MPAIEVWLVIGKLILMRNVVHIGTSGWSYKHWKDVFYHKDLPARNWLSHYANHFDCVEINSSFYKLPTRATAEQWAKNVPPGFKLCPKMSRFLTHNKKLNDPEEPLERFSSIFDVIQKRLGPILLQLPDNLRFAAEKTEHLYALMKKKYGQYRFAIEPRHVSWMEKESLALMKKYKIAFVISYSGNHFPYAEEVTAKDVYIRFHGPAALYASGYTPAMLHDYAKKISAWINAGHRCWAFFNNDVHAHALKDAERLNNIINSNRNIL